MVEKLLTLLCCLAVPASDNAADRDVGTVLETLSAIALLRFIPKAVWLEEEDDDDEEEDDDDDYDEENKKSRKKRRLG